MNCLKILLPSAKFSCNERDSVKLKAPDALEALYSTCEMVQEWQGGFLGDSVMKNLPANEGDAGDGV